MFYRYRSLFEMLKYESKKYSILIKRTNHP